MNTSLSQSFLDFSSIGMPLLEHYLIQEVVPQLLTFFVLSSSADDIVTELIKGG